MAAAKWTRDFLRKLILLILILGASAGGLLLWQHFRPKPNPDLSILRDQLDAAAERSFPVPSLEVKRLEVTISEEKIGALIQTTIEFAEKNGGTAMQGLDCGDAKVILATLPGNKLAGFEAAVGKAAFRKQAEVETRSAGLEIVDCEVIIHPEVR